MGDKNRCCSLGFSHHWFYSFSLRFVELLMLPVIWEASTGLLREIVLLFWIVLEVPEQAFPCRYPEQIIPFMGPCQNVLYPVCKDQSWSFWKDQIGSESVCFSVWGLGLISQVVAAVLLCVLKYFHVLCLVVWDGLFWISWAEQHVVSPKNPLNYLDWWFITIPNVWQEYLETSLGWSHPIRNTPAGLWEMVLVHLHPLEHQAGLVFISFSHSSGPVCFHWSDFPSLIWLFVLR